MSGTARVVMVERSRRSESIEDRHQVSAALRPERHLDRTVVTCDVTGKRFTSGTTTFDANAAAVPDSTADSIQAPSDPGTAHPEHRSRSRPVKRPEMDRTRAQQTAHWSHCPIGSECPTAERRCRFECRVRLPLGSSNVDGRFSHAGQRFERNRSVGGSRKENGALSPPR